jgi:hypothetical protein
MEIWLIHRMDTTSSSFGCWDFLPTGGPLAYYLSVLMFLGTHTHTQHLFSFRCFHAGFQVLLGCITWWVAWWRSSAQWRQELISNFLQNDSIISSESGNLAHIPGLPGVIDHTDSLQVRQEVDFDKRRKETFSKRCAWHGVARNARLLWDLGPRECCVESQHNTSPATPLQKVTSPAHCDHI